MLLGFSGLGSYIGGFRVYRANIGFRILRVFKSFRAFWGIYRLYRV